MQGILYRVDQLLSLMFSKSNLRLLELGSFDLIQNKALCYEIHVYTRTLKPSILSVSWDNLQIEILARWHLDLAGGRIILT
jgi:hypothetical protein